MTTVYPEPLRALLKPILPYLEDESVSEVVVHGPHEVWVERGGRLQRTEASFTEEGLLGAARQLAQAAGRVLDEERPRVEGRLADGTWVHAVLPPIARRGLTLCLRKRLRGRLTLEALEQQGTLSAPMAWVLEAALHCRLNILVAGGAGSGRTTLMHALGVMLPAHERILTVEEVAELQLPQPYVVSLEGRAGDRQGRGAVEVGELLQWVPRLRPDRLLVGEVRGAEAWALLQALHGGSGGALCGVQAHGSQQALQRLESLCLLAGVSLPPPTVRTLVASAFQLVLCCERLADGSRRVVELAEVLPAGEHGELRTWPLFTFTPLVRGAEQVLGYHAPTGLVPTFLERARAAGFPELVESFFDPATYKLPPPLAGPRGGVPEPRWVPSLRHRAQGEPDPERFAQERQALAQRLQEEARGGTQRVSSTSELPQLPPLLEEPPTAALRGATPRPSPPPPPPEAIEHVDEEDIPSVPTRPLGIKVQSHGEEATLAGEGAQPGATPPRPAQASRPPPPPAVRPGLPAQPPRRTPSGSRPSPIVRGPPAPAEGGAQGAQGGDSAVERTEIHPVPGRSRR